MAYFTIELCIGGFSKNFTRCNKKTVPKLIIGRTEEQIGKKRLKISDWKALIVEGEDGVYLLVGGGLS